MLLDFLVFREDLFAVKGVPNPGPRHPPSQNIVSFRLLKVKKFSTFISNNSQNNLL
jgi:hypothetical protein